MFSQLLIKLTRKTFRFGLGEISVFSLFFLFLLSFGSGLAADQAKEFPHGLAIKIRPGASISEIAHNKGASSYSRVAYLADTWLLHFGGPDDAETAIPQSTQTQGRTEASNWRDDILWQEKQVPEPLFPQIQPANPLNFRDPDFLSQWYLLNRGQTGGLGGIDVNVVPAWRQQINGTGIVIAVVDDALQGNHPDLSANFRPDLSFNFNDNNSDVLPRSSSEKHGTAVAGIMAMRDNTIGGVGVAHRSSLAGIRLIAAPTTDAVRANALSHNRNQIAVYNNSWGPGGSEDDDTPIRFRGPGRLTREALEDNSRFGRNGLGNIYVFSAGNRRARGANTNFNGYTNSRYTIAVGAIGQRGLVTRYSNPGASLALVAPSDGDAGSIFTTDLTGGQGDGPVDFRSNFGGTSASAPMVSAAAALILQTNPGLNWREVLDILLKTAVQVDRNHSDWVRNGAGFSINHDYGFGSLDIMGAINLARNYPGLPVAQFQEVDSGNLNRRIPDNSPSGTASVIQVNNALRLEHVKVDLEIDHPRWGDLEVTLISPSGTRSTLSTPHASSSGNVRSWRFMSLRHWGENSQGEWRLEVRDLTSGVTGRLVRWRLRLHGPNQEESPNRNPIANDLLVPSIDFPIDIAPLLNDSDPDGDNLKIISVTQPNGGRVTLLNPSTIRYERTQGILGDDTFSYTISDGRGGTSQAFITVRLPLPQSKPTQVVTPFFQPLIFDPTLNDTDPGNLPLTLIQVNPAEQGTVTRGSGNLVNYQPPAVFPLSENFNYTITNSEGFTDSSTITVVSTATPDASLRFAGSDHRVRVPPAGAFNLTGSLTVEAWIYPRNWGEEINYGFGRVVDRENYLLFISGQGNPFYEDNSLVLFLRQANGSETGISSSANSIQLNRWQHVAATFDGNETVRLFINGKPQTLTAELDPLRGTLENLPEEPLFIGDTARGDRSFDGNIREVRVWNRALTENEIREGLQRFRPPFGNGLVARFALNEGSGILASGTGAQSYTGEIRGAFWEAGRNTMEFYYGAPVPFGNDWHFSDWKGWVFGSDSPWSYHAEHGWIYVVGPTENQLWYYDPPLGWLYTEASYYPFVWRAQTGSWHFYERNSSPRWFYNFATETWFNP